MSADQARRMAREIAEGLEARDYEYWSAQTLPIEYEETREGMDVYVEIMLLERTDEYIQLGVDVDCCQQPRCNAMYSTVIYRLP